MDRETNMSDPIKLLLSQLEIKELNEAPLPWFNKSLELKTAAGVLLNVGSVFSIYLMLCGMSLELIYKAIIVVRNNRFDSVKKINIGKHHNLVNLAHFANIGLNEKNKAFLNILTHYIYWEGRYPTPNKAEDMVELEKLSKKYLFTEIPDGKGFYKVNDFLSWDNFEALWDQGKKEFWQIYDT